MSINVFLSSRFEEFRELREKIIEEFKNMEQLGVKIINLDDNRADVRPPLSRSLENIKKSDYMIFILGETYGDIQMKYSKSYIHLEYEEATSKQTKTKVLAYLIGDSYIGERYSDNQNLSSLQHKVQKNAVNSKIKSEYDIKEVAKRIRDDFQRTISQVYSNEDEKIETEGQKNVKKQKDEIKPPKNFNMTDETLSIIYKNRKKLVEEKKIGINYEFWEVANPSKQYILILFPSSIIHKTVQDFINKYESNNKQLPKQIVILKEKQGTKSSTFEEFDNRNISISVHSYSNFYWDYCIDNTFKDDKHKIDVEENYIDQDFYSFQDYEKIGSSKEIVRKFIREESISPIMAIIAQAGVGKTTFLEYMTNIINNSPDKHCILISSVDFKEHYSNLDSDKIPEITSIYDFYSMYSKIDSLQNRHHLGEKIFNIGLFNGNIIIVIDGLDEIITLFQERFYLDKFVNSLVELNKQLGKCKIIISSREYTWSKNLDMHEGEIKAYRLQGFTENLLDEYLDKRYNADKQAKQQYANKVKKYLNEIEDITDNKKYAPFVVDLVCEMAEEEADDDHEDSEDTLPYDSNNEAIDKVIYSTLKRETIRQNFQGINVIELLDIFIDFATEYNENISSDEFIEAIEMRYPTTYKEIIQSLRFSPLLKSNDTAGVSFKYDILKNYFISLSIIRLFSSEKTDETYLKHLSRMYKSESPIFKDIKKYFHNGKQKIFMHNAKKIMRLLAEKYKRIDTNSTIKKTEIEYSISAILYLLVSVNSEQLSADKKMDLICELYGNDQILQYLFIYGNFFELDFSNLEIRDSKFDGYTKFLKSKFDNTKFFYSQFKNIKGTLPSQNNDILYFDVSCELFDLAGQVRNTEQLSIEGDLRLILKQVYNKNGSFSYRIEKSKEYAVEQMRCLVVNGIVDSEEKEVHINYSMSNDTAIKAEVKHFLQNGKNGRVIKKVLKCFKKL